MKKGMTFRLGLLAILSLLIATTTFPGAIHAQQELPTSTYTYDKTGKLQFCITVPPVHSGFIHGIEFSGTWAPDKATPLDQFTAAAGWTWDVDPIGVWRTTRATTGMTF